MKNGPTVFSFHLSNLPRLDVSFRVNVCRRWAIMRGETWLEQLACSAGNIPTRWRWKINSFPRLPRLIISDCPVIEKGSDAGRSVFLPRNWNPCPAFVPLLTPEKQRVVVLSLFMKERNNPVMHRWTASYLCPLAAIFHF